jgi:hypothetical protein
VHINRLIAFVPHITAKRCWKCTVELILSPQISA